MKCTLMVSLGLLILTVPVFSQVTASLSTSELNRGEYVTVDMNGLQANTQYDVQLVGQSVDGQQSCTEIDVTTDSNGHVDWDEQINWPGDGITYTTWISFRQGGGHYTQASSGNLKVNGS